MPKISALPTAAQATLADLTPVTQGDLVTRHVTNNQKLTLWRDNLVTNLTPGSVLFVSNASKIGEDNDKFNFDNVNDTLAVGAPSTELTIGGVTKRASILGISNGQAERWGISSLSYGSGVECVVSMLYARGSQVSPSALMSGDQVGRLCVSGYDGTDYAYAGNMRWVAEENFTGTASGSYCEINVTPPGTQTPTNAFTIKSDNTGLYESNPQDAFHITRATDETEIRIENKNAAGLVKSAGLVSKNTSKQVFTGINEVGGIPVWTVYDTTSVVPRMRYDLTNDGLMVGSRSVVAETSTISFNGVTQTAKYYTEYENATTNGFVGINHGNGNPVSHVGAVSNGTVAAPAIVVDGQTSLDLRGLGYDGSTYRIMGEMEFQVAGTPGAGDMPGRWLLSVTPDGSSTPSTVINATADRVTVGNASDAATKTLHVQSNEDAIIYLESDADNSGEDHQAQMFYSQDGGEIRYAQGFFQSRNEYYFAMEGAAAVQEKFIFLYNSTITNNGTGNTPTVTTLGSSALSISAATGLNEIYQAEVQTRCDVNTYLTAGTQLTVHSNSTFEYEGSTVTPAIATSNAGSISYISNLQYAAAFGPSYIAGRARGSEGTPTIVSNGDDIGGYIFAGYDGADFRQGALIEGVVDATPSANVMPTAINFYTENSSGTSAIRMVLNSDGTLTHNYGEYLPTAGGTASLLDYYEEGSFTVTWEGPWATNQTNRDIKFTRVGNVVTLEIEAVIANAGAGSVSNIFLNASTQLPSRLIPTGYTTEKMIWTVDNGTYAPGTISIDLTGNITIYPGALSSSNFSGAGDTGFGASGAAIEITYLV